MRTIRGGGDATQRLRNSATPSESLIAGGALLAYALSAQLFPAPWMYWLARRAVASRLSLVVYPIREDLAHLDAEDFIAAWRAADARLSGG